MMFRSLLAATIIACATPALAGPVPVEKRTAPVEKRTFGSGASVISSPFYGSFSNPFQHVSLSGWGGFSSLNHFDDFYGIDNFSGNHDFSSLVAVQEQQLVCHSLDVSIIQQQLLIVQEYVKKIITTQICEVETQTIVFSQFQSSLFNFGHDIRHLSGRQLGFDEGIANQIVNLHDSHGQLYGNNFGFKGTDYGSNFVFPSGFNWNDSSSPASVAAAFSAAQSAAYDSSFSAPPSSSGFSFPPANVSEVPSLVAPPSDSGDSSSADPNPASD